MEKILNQILSKLETLESGQKEIAGDVKEINRKVSIIFDQTANLTEVTTDLKELKKDVAFVCHKEFETEKDVFNIKKHLEIIK